MLQTEGYLNRYLQLNRQAMPGITCLLRAWAAQHCEQARNARRCSVRASAQSSGHYERVLRYPNGMICCLSAQHP